MSDAFASQQSARRRERSMGRLPMSSLAAGHTLEAELAAVRLEKAEVEARLIAETAAKVDAEARCAKLEAETVALRAENSHLAAALALATQTEDAQRGEPHAAEVAAEREAQAAVAKEEAAGECTFFFVPVARLHAGRAKGELTLPRFQELRDEGVLVERTLTRSECYRAKHTGKLLAVSHRWERPDAPDTQGVQSKAIVEHVAGTGIELVWFDYWCMPQAKRTLAERASFKWMLQNVNLLYLGCSVLLLADISYLSRFWTQVRISYHLPSSPAFSRQLPLAPAFSRLLPPSHAFSRLLIS